MGQLRKTVKQLASVSGGLGRVAEELDQRSARQSDAAASMATGMDQLTTSLTQVADNRGCQGGRARVGFCGGG